MRKPALFLAVVSAFVLQAAWTTLAFAAPITTLRNTGVDSLGNPLAEGAIDPHYQLIAAPAGSGHGPAAYVADSSKFPFTDPVFNWLANDSTSQWIAPQADQSVFPNEGNTGLFVYRTTFDLTGHDPSTAVLAGRWIADDIGLDILINGQSTGIQFEGVDPSRPFLEFVEFTIASGFQPGLNTLDFVIENLSLGHPGINPTGLRVELSGTAALVPEPTTLGMGLVGLILVGGVLGVKRMRGTR